MLPCGIYKNINDFINTQKSRKFIRTDVPLDFMHYWIFENSLQYLDSCAERC